MNRTPPHSVEAEQGCLGSMLIDRNAIGEALERINEEYFYTPAHKTIYNALVELWRSGAQSDFITFTQVLRDRNILDVIGGASFITSLYTFVPTAANIVYYLDILQDKYILRGIIEVLTEGTRRAYEEQDDVNGLLDDTERKVLSIRPGIGKNRTVSMSENLNRAVDRADAVMSGTAMAGLPTGIASLDSKLGGLHSGETIVITAETGGGKSACAHNIAEYVGLVLKKTVMIFSYELPALTVTNRIIACRAGINTEHIRKGKMTGLEMSMFMGAVEELREARITIDDNASTNLLQLQSKARRQFADKDGLNLVIVDYAQKIPASGKKDRSRQQEIAENSDGLQKLAMELNIPIVVLAQRNLDGTMREARDVAMDAKTVLKIVRENDDEAIEDEPNMAPRKIVIAKNNNGSLGVVKVMFNKPFVRFERMPEEVEV